MTVSIDIWSDVACPWCYIGKARFERALEAFEQADQMEVRWHSYLLDPSLPKTYDGSEIDYLVETKGLSRQQVQQMVAGVSQNASAEGLTMDFERVRPANSTSAHLVIQQAKRLGADVPALEDALFRAHFTDGEVISDPDVLVRAGAKAGLTDQQVRAALTDDACRGAFEQDLATARRLGIRGVPFFVLADHYGISGAQPSAVFAQALDRVWTEAQAHLITVEGGAGQACGPQGC